MVWSRSTDRPLLSQDLNTARLPLWWQGAEDRPDGLAIRPACRSPCRSSLATSAPKCGLLTLDHADETSSGTSTNDLTIYSTNSFSTTCSWLLLDGSGYGYPMLIEDAAHRVTGLRSLSQPILNLVDLQDDLLVGFSQRMVLSNFVQGPSLGFRPLVHHHDSVIGALLAAEPFQSHARAHLNSSCEPNSTYPFVSALQLGIFYFLSAYAS